MAVPRRDLLSPAAIAVVALGVAATIGILIAEQRALAIGLLATAVFVPITMLDLRLGIVAWIPTLFFLAVPHLNAGVHAASVLLVVAWIGTLRVRGRPAAAIVARHAKLVAAVVAFVAWLTMSLAWAQTPGVAVVPLLAWAVSAALFIVILTSVTKPRYVIMILAAFVLGATLSVLLGLFYNGLQAGSAATTTLTEYEGRLRGGIGDPNYLAASIVPALAIAFGLLAATRRPLARWALVAAMSILLIGLAATQSRGGAVAFVVALIAGALLVRRGRAHVLALTSAACIGAVAFFIASPGAWHRITSNANEGNGRVTQWTLAWRMAKDHPIVGVGLQNFQVHEAHYVPRPGTLQYVGLVVAHPHVVHDVYLQLLSETGVVGLALFACVVLGCMRAMWLASRRLEKIGQRSVSRLALAVLVATISSLAGSVFLSNGSDAQLWILLALGPVLLGIARAMSGTERWPQEVRVPAAYPFRGADERGEPAGAFSLGTLLEAQGDLDGALAAYRRADERGDAEGAFRLGRVLENRGDLTGSERAYRRAQERGHVLAESSLRGVVEHRSRLAAANATLGRADQTGDGSGEFTRVAPRERRDADADHRTRRVRRATDARARETAPVGRTASSRPPTRDHRHRIRRRLLPVLGLIGVALVAAIAIREMTPTPGSSSRRAAPPSAAAPKPGSTTAAADVPTPHEPAAKRRSPANPKARAARRAARASRARASRRHNERAGGRASTLTPSTAPPSTGSAAGGTSTGGSLNGGSEPPAGGGSSGIEPTSSAGSAPPAGRGSGPPSGGGSSGTGITSGGGSGPPAGGGSSGTGITSGGGSGPPAGGGSSGTGITSGGG